MPTQALKSPDWTYEYTRTCGLKRKKTSNADEKFKYLNINKVPKAHIAEIEKFIKKCEKKSPKTNGLVPYNEVKIKLGLDPGRIDAVRPWRFIEGDDKLNYSFHPVKNIWKLTPKKEKTIRKTTKRPNLKM
jgi:hypothetical protein